MDKEMDFAVKISDIADVLFAARDYINMAMSLVKELEKLSAGKSEELYFMICLHLDLIEILGTIENWTDDCNEWGNGGRGYWYEKLLDSMRKEHDHNG